MERFWELIVDQLLFKSAIWSNTQSGPCSSITKKTEDSKLLPQYKFIFDHSCVQTHHICVRRLWHWSEDGLNRNRSPNKWILYQWLQSFVFRHFSWKDVLPALINVCIRIAWWMKFSVPSLGIYMPKMYYYILFLMVYQSNKMFWTSTSLGSGFISKDSYTLLLKLLITILYYHSVMMCNLIGTYYDTSHVTNVIMANTSSTTRKLLIIEIL